MLGNLPILSVPIPRTALVDRSLFAGPADGLHASQSSCDGLTGLAQQMCYAVMYNV